MSPRSSLPAGPDLTAAEAVKTLLAHGIAIAEGKADSVPKSAFESAHRDLLNDPVAKRIASGALKRCSSPDLLWGHLRSVATGSGSWALRRDAVHDLLDPIGDALQRDGHPVDDLVSGAAARLSAESVQDAWTEALQRRGTQPEGAVTMARTLLESTIKTILDDRGVPYRRQDDLPKLYRAVGKELGLAPDGYHIPRKPSGRSSAAAAQWSPASAACAIKSVTRMARAESATGRQPGTQRWQSTWPDQWLSSSSNLRGQPPCCCGQPLTLNLVPPRPLFCQKRALIKGRAEWGYRYRRQALVRSGFGPGDESDRAALVSVLT